MGKWKILSSFVLLAVVVAGCGGTDSDTSDAASVTSADETTTTKAPVDKGPKPTCAYTGTDDSGDMQVEFTFTNPLGEVDVFDVTYALLDGEGGTRFLTKSPIVQWGYFPGTNEQFRVSASALEGVPPNIDESSIACAVLGIEDSSNFGGFQRASASDTCTVLGTDSSGRIEVDVAVTSPYKETTKVQTWWALRAPGPVRFGVGTDVTDLVGSGETLRIIPEFGESKPEWVGEGEVTCVVLGFWDQEA